MKKLPRGIRNNNPGNIRKTITHWRGETSTESETAFEVFDTPVYGVRASMIVLLNYYLKHQLGTVEKIIARWAPPNENNTGAYAAAVARRLGVAVDARLNLFDADTLTTLASAIFLHENGKPPAPKADWYDKGVYKQAADLAYKAIR